MKHYDRLKDKVCIVTGATRGIGRAIALAYAKEGAKLVIAGRNAAQLDELAEIIAKDGGEAYPVPTDIKDRASVMNLFDKTLEKYGRLDVSLHNAGIAKFIHMVDFTDDIVHDIWDTNLWGSYWCMQRAAQIMIDQNEKGIAKGGKIINLSSITYQTGQLGLGIYGATKAGIALMTKCLALELAPYHINVNGIGPGTILTDINRNDLDFERDEREIPLGIGQPEDIAGIAIFLATEESDYCTGHIYYVDGGYNTK